MKKIFLIIFLFSIHQIIAQEIAGNRLSFNIQLGINTSFPKTSELISGNVEEKPIIESKPNIGGYVSFGGIYSINERSNIELDLGYHLNRFSIVSEIGPLTSIGIRSISQIQLPISYNYSIGTNKAYQIGTGFYSNYLFSVFEKGITKGYFENLLIDEDDPLFSDFEDNYNDDKMEYFNKLSFGALIQIKKNINFSNFLKGFIQLRIKQDFNAIKNRNSNSSIDSYKQQNEKEATLFDLGIGIRF